MRPLGVWVLLLLPGFFVLAQGEDVYPRRVNPPFGLYWAEGQKEIERVLDHAGARIVDKESVEGRDAWTVEGLLQPALKRTVFYFGNEKTLVEVNSSTRTPIGISLRTKNSSTVPGNASKLCMGRRQSWLETKSRKAT